MRKKRSIQSTSLLRLLFLLTSRNAGMSCQRLRFSSSSDPMILIILLSHLPRGPSSSRIFASQGQNRSLPVVSHPHTGQRFVCALRKTRGRSGTNRNKKKNGSPAIQHSALIAVDPASRNKLSFQDFTRTPLDLVVSCSDIPCFCYCTDSERRQGIRSRPEFAVQIISAKFP